MWSESMMYKEYHSPLGFKSKVDYWEHKEDTDNSWVQLEEQAELVRQSYLYYLEASQSQPLTIDCIS